MVPTSRIAESTERIEHMVLTAEVAEFLYFEADLLDERRYKEWLELFSDDFTYAMPLRLNVSLADQQTRDATQPGSEVCWFDEGKETLIQRVEQLLTGLHWAEEPVSRVSHLVTNIRLREVTLPDVVVSCRFLVYRNRVADETDVLVGRRTDTIRQVDGEWKFSRRRLLIDQNVLSAKNLTVFF
jgi:3-phenylpropionate/cinnamic acid dioxygenase small subunit